MKTVLTCFFAVSMLIAFSAPKDAQILPGKQTQIQHADSLSLAIEILKVKSYPNPFTGQVTFILHKSLPADAEIAIYDISGRKITSLEYEENSTTILWDGTGSSGQRVNPGAYFFVMAGDQYYGRGKVVFSP